MMVFTNTRQLAEFIFKSSKMQKEKLLQIPDFKNFSPKTTMPPTRNYAPSESPKCKIKEKILQTPDLKNFSLKTTPNSAPPMGVTPVRCFAQLTTLPSSALVKH